MLLTIPVLESTFVVSGADAVVTEIARLLAPAASRRPAATHTLDIGADSVLLDGSPTTSATADADLVTTVLTLMNAQALADTSAFAVHAGVISGEGGALAFPAVSGAGKSTLVAACLRAGATYVSDEALLLDDDLLLRPYVKPINLTAWSLRELGLPPPSPGQDERAVAVSELGGRYATQRLALTHVVQLQRGRRTDSIQLARSEAARLLLERSFNHFRNPGRAVRIATGVAASATCVSITYATPAGGAALLMDLLGG